MRVRTIIIAVIACVLGPWMLWSGSRDYQTSKRLAAEGRTTNAHVVDRSITTSSRGVNRYYLNVQFLTDAGRFMGGKVQVNQGEYQKATAGGTVALRYLPSDPKVCAVGKSVPAWRGKLMSGSFLLLSGCALAMLGRSRLNTRKAAEKVAASVGALCESEYKYASVNPNDFRHLDLSWYDTTQRWMEEKGFALLGNEENLTFQRTSKGNRTLLRTMLGRDGTSLAYVYH